VRLLLHIGFAVLASVSLGLGVTACGTYRNITPHDRERATQIFELGPDASLELVSVRFDRKAHVVESDLEKNGFENVRSIDGISFFGTDGNLPTREVAGAKVIFRDGRTVSLDVKGMYDPDSPGTYGSLFSLARQEEEESYLLKGHFGDGAGSYDAEWRIRNGTATRTSIESNCGAYGDPDAPVPHIPQVEPDILTPPTLAQLQSDFASSYPECFVDHTYLLNGDQAALNMGVQFHCGTSGLRKNDIFHYVQKAAVWKFVPRPAQQ